MSSTTRRVVAVCLAVGGLLFLAPTIAQAVCPGNGQVLGILTETMENPPAQAPPLGPLAAGAVVNGSRLAEATELGTLFPVCGPLAAALAGNVTVHARSRVPILAVGATFIDLGIGTISGTFIVDTASGTVPGKIHGTLDFSLTHHDAQVPDCGGGPCPIVGAVGSWSTQGSFHLSGTFYGVALVPFDCGVGPTGLCYLDPTGALPGALPGTPLVPLDPATDFDRFGNPDAKFVITLTAD